MAINKNTIAQLPLFIGLSNNELNEIAQKVSFTQHHHKKGAAITRSGNRCTSLITIANGTVEAETVADDNSYLLTENLHAVYTIEPDKVFGLEQRYRSTYRALTSCDTVEISKDSLLELIGKYLIVKINYLNIVCRNTQKLEHNPWKVHPTDTKQAIVAFIKNRVKHPAGSKCLHIKMTDLAEELSASRGAVSQALNELAEQERIILRRGIIEIPALQLL